MGSIALGVVALLVLYRVLILIANSFQVGQFGTPSHFGLDNWSNAFRSAKVSDALKNTVTLSITRQAIALVVGVLVA